MFYLLLFFGNDIIITQNMFLFIKEYTGKRESFQKLRIGTCGGAKITVYGMKNMLYNECQLIF